MVGEGGPVGLQVGPTDRLDAWRCIETVAVRGSDDPDRAFVGREVVGGGPSPVLRPIGLKYWPIRPLDGEIEMNPGPRRDLSLIQKDSDLSQGPAAHSAAGLGPSRTPCRRMP